MHNTSTNGALNTKPQSGQQWFLKSGYSNVVGCSVIPVLQPKILFSALKHFGQVHSKHDYLALLTKQVLKW